jgi:hypothetical protein
VLWEDPIHGRGTVPCARFDHPREGRSPLCPVASTPGRGAVLRARQFFRMAATPSYNVRETAPLCVLCVSVVKPKTRVCPRNSCGRRGRRPSQSTIREGHGPPCPFPTPLIHGRGTVPCARLSYPREGHSPLCPIRSSPGRGAVLCARKFHGPRGRGPSHASGGPPHPSLCPLCLCGETKRGRCFEGALWMRPRSPWD